jgi:uncharacterized protein with HEPN domain
MKDRDSTILKKINQYADEVSGTITRFNLDYAKFKQDYVMKNAIGMCILQIGELVGKLSDRFKDQYQEMPWRDIVAIRNKAAHAYSSIDTEFLWKTAINKIPELSAYCKNILSQIIDSQKDK